MKSFGPLLIQSGHQTIVPTIIKYPDGGLTVRVTERLDREITVYARLRTSDDILSAHLLADVLARVSPYTRAHLVVLYSSSSRQDRMCAYGDSVGKVILTGVEELFDSSVSLFSHSDEWDEGAENKLVNAYLAAIGTGPGYLQSGNIILGDKSANKTVWSNANYGDKIRNPETGAITGFQLVVGKQPDADKPMTVFDDIFDGGRTILECINCSLEKFPNLINVVVPHFIGSNQVLLDELCSNAKISFYITNTFQNESEVLSLIPNSKAKFFMLDMIDGDAFAQIK